MINVLFFAQIREIIGVGSLELDGNGLTVDELLALLSKRGDKWSLALTERTVLCAVNKVLVDYKYSLKSGDEVAFFPPVTGG